MGKWITENEVVEAVCKYLKRHGYRIDGQCDTSQHGVDIVATHRATGRGLNVEAKGGTSSKTWTRRSGKPFNKGQVRSHVGQALLAAAILRSRAGTSGVVAIALPGNDAHRNLIADIAPVLTKLKIAIFWVEEATKRVSKGL